ncbi:MAG: FtsX-like permease family protein [Planctomycetales bacterium]|nr:FtsX-like permease family protein [Planctomycetales bacterium]
MRTALAWKNLTHKPGKCALAATGVGFAVLLMFMQIGFRNALIDNNVQLFTLFDTRLVNLVMVSTARYNLSTEQRFPQRLLEQAASIPGVQKTCAVNIERGTAKVMVSGYAPRPLRVIGIELNEPSFFADRQLYEKLREADGRQAALVDTRSKPAYGFATSPEPLRQQRIELNRQALPVVEQFRLGTDFGNDGTLLMSVPLLEQYFPWRSPNGTVVDIGLLQVAARSTEEIEQIAARLEQLAPTAIQVQRTEQFIRREQEFWASNTPIGKIFFMGTLMGLVVGAIICYQIQFTDISEHLPEFATLKAMGYGPGYFWRLVLCQSFYLACLGFVPGWLVSLGLYSVLSASSGLVLQMSPERMGLVWLLTLIMCIVSGLFAIRKLFRSDPANLF